jgi:hypothetical protein
LIRLSEEHRQAVRTLSRPNMWSYVEISRDPISGDFAWGTLVLRDSPRSKRTTSLEVIVGQSLDWRCVRWGIRPRPCTFGDFTWYPCPHALALATLWLKGHPIQRAVPR